MYHRAALLSVYTVQLYARKQLSATEWEVAKEGSTHQNQGLTSLVTVRFSPCWGRCKVVVFQRINIVSCICASRWSAGYRQSLS